MKQHRQGHQVSHNLSVGVAARLPNQPLCLLPHLVDTPIQHQKQSIAEGDGNGNAYYRPNGKLNPEHSLSYKGRGDNTNDRHPSQSDELAEAPHQFALFDG